MLINISIVLLAIGIIVISLLLTNVNHTCRNLREEVHYLQNIYLHELEEKESIYAELKQIRREKAANAPQGCTPCPAVQAQENSIKEKSPVA